MYYNGCFLLLRDPKMKKRLVLVLGGLGSKSDRMEHIYNIYRERGYEVQTRMNTWRELLVPSKTKAIASEIAESLVDHPHVGVHAVSTSNWLAYELNHARPNNFDFLILEGGPQRPATIEGFSKWINTQSPIPVASQLVNVAMRCVGIPTPKDHDWIEHYKSVRNIPNTHIIVGSEDPLIDHEYVVDYINSNTFHARLNRIENAKHLNTFTVDPDGYKNAIHRAIDEVVNLT